MRFGRIAALAAGTALAVVLTGCGPAFVRVEEPAQRDEQTIDLGAAQALDVELRIGVGTMEVTGGTSKAMEARFDYRPLSWKPEVRYSVNGTSAELVVEQPNVDHGPLLGDARNSWDIKLNDSVPLVLRAKSGVGRSKLDLAGLHVRRLDVEGGVGETTIDLGSVARDDMTIDVEGGVGKIVLRVPREAGVRVFGYQDGIGDFNARGFDRNDSNEMFNEAYGKPGVKQYDVRITRGVGDVTIEQQ